MNNFDSKNAIIKRGEALSVCFSLTTPICGRFFIFEE